MLQSTTVYANVSKARRFTNVGNVAEPLPQGVLANKDDLMKAFGTRDEERVCLMARGRAPALTVRCVDSAGQILERGELQVSEKERKSEYETLFRDVVQVLVDKCVHPETGRPYTSGVLDRALRSVHFAVDPTRSAKQQALDALPRLQREFPIVRARMRFRVAVRREHAPQLRALLREQPHTLEGEEDGEITLTGEPSFRTAQNVLTTTSSDLHRRPGLLSHLRRFHAGRVRRQCATGRAVARRD